METCSGLKRGEEAKRGPRTKSDMQKFGDYHRGKEAYGQAAVWANRSNQLLARVFKL